MLKGDLVREMMARKERGEGIKRIARELGVDRKTVRRWLKVGGWQRRRSGPRRRPIDQFTEFIAQRGPEVGWNGVVLHRELAGLDLAGLSAPMTVEGAVDAAVFRTYVEQVLGPTLKPGDIVVVGQPGGAQGRGDCRGNCGQGRTANSNTVQLSAYDTTYCRFGFRYILHIAERCLI
jgi:Homeodomain-like domain